MDKVPPVLPDISTEYLKWYENHYQIKNQQYKYQHNATVFPTNQLSTITSSSLSSSTSLSLSGISNPVPTTLNTIPNFSIYHHIQALQKLQALDQQSNPSSATQIFTNIIQNELSRY